MYKHSTIFETYWNYLNASALLLNTIVFGTHAALPDFSGSLNSYNKQLGSPPVPLILEKFNLLNKITTTTWTQTIRQTFEPTNKPTNDHSSRRPDSRNAQIVTKTTLKTSKNAFNKSRNINAMLKRQRNQLKLLKRLTAEQLLLNSHTSRPTYTYSFPFSSFGLAAVFLGRCIYFSVSLQTNSWKFCSIKINSNANGLTAERQTK